MLAALKPDAALGAEAVAALRLATTARGILARDGAGGEGAGPALPSAVASAARQATDAQARARLGAVLALEQAPSRRVAYAIT